MTNWITTAEEAASLVSSVQKILQDPQFQAEEAAFVEKVKEGFALEQALVAHANTLYHLASPSLSAELQKLFPKLPAKS
jgi:hypothetical protein